MEAFQTITSMVCKASGVGGNCDFSSPSGALVNINTKVGINFSSSILASLVKMVDPRTATTLLLAVLLFSIAVLFILSWIVQLLWNATIAHFSKDKYSSSSYYEERKSCLHISYWQAMGLFILANILFK